jgi:hypothetical protein
VLASLRAKFRLFVPNSVRDEARASRQSPVGAESASGLISGL